MPKIFGLILNIVKTFPTFNFNETDFMINNPLSKVLSTTLIAAFSCAIANAQGVIYTASGDGYRVPTSSCNVAGSTKSVSSGDAVSITNAVLSSPSGVAKDGAGNIYVADYANHRICMISPSGAVSAIAGTGVYGYLSKDGLTLTNGVNFPKTVFAEHAGDAAAPDFFAYCAYGSSNQTGKTFDVSGSVKESAKSGGSDIRIELPKAIWKDNAGNLIVADQGNNRICKVDAVTNAVHTISGGTGNGFSPDGTSAVSCQWGSITGVCADDRGNIYVSDGQNHVVRMIDINGSVRTIAGTGVSGYSGDGGFALGATFRTPGSLFINAAGDLFICDPSSNVVRVVNVCESGSLIETLAGNGKMGFSGDGGRATAAELNNPSMVWQDPTGVIYIADKGNVRTRTIVNSTFSSNKSAAFSIYPNPSEGTFNLITNAAPGTSSVDVFNVLGEKVYSQSISGQQATVVLNQPAGVYDVVVKSAGVATNQKVVIGK